MMLAIMQPYFLPYVGYFQLLALTRKFVVLDNVNFIKSGYIHRNRIWLGRHSGWLSLPVDNASPNRKIQDHNVTLSSRERARVLRMAAQGYARAPNRDEGMAILEASLPHWKCGLVDTLMAGLRASAEALQLHIDAVKASDLDIDPELQGQARILAICQHLRTDIYVNLPGGRSLYDPQVFARAGLGLGFVEPALLHYNQGRTEFTPSLSILDLIMHVAPADRLQHLQAATIEWATPVANGVS